MGYIKYLKRFVEESTEMQYDIRYGDTSKSYRWMALLVLCLSDPNNFGWLYKTNGEI